MLQTLNLRLVPEVAYNPGRLKSAAAHMADIDQSRIVRIDIVKRSIDARQRQVYVNLMLNLHIDSVDESAAIATPETYTPLLEDAPAAVVVGAGPAGLFAALRLIQEGVRPIVLERGKDVDARRRDLAVINRTGNVSDESNYCFGEGGAGAYSDGKLYTRSKKRGSVSKILNILHQHGASADILVDAHPHIGSDRLPGIIRAIRQTIIRCGGEVHFSTRVDSLTSDNAGNVTGVTTADGKTFSGPVILATGHSARDVYRYLQDAGIALQPKGLAIGVRLEHPQTLIDRIQYHSPKGRGKYLPAAEYSLLTRVDDRAVYSFCMCPGGFIIPAASAPGQLVVNGMSPANRGTRWANSGMVVEVLPEDIPGDDPLRMLHLQENIEEAFFADAAANHQDGKTDNPQNAPAQRMTDFVNSRPSSSLPSTSYAPGIHPARIDRLLPDFIARRLRGGLRYFGNRQRGFMTDEASMIGCETRTSAPVRIPRDPESLVHITTPGLYPVGEGAGYAGGIVSAAIDGDRAAEAVAALLNGTGPGQTA